MAGRSRGPLDRLVQRAAALRWQRAAADAREASLDDLRRDRSAARRMKRHLDAFLHVAEGRLALPAIGTQAFPRPHDTDWAWRPEAWCGPLAVPGIAAAPSKAPLGDEATLFHDCRVSEVTMRQVRNTRAADLAPFGLRLDVFRFDGTYLSLAVDLPPAAALGLQRRHLIRLESIVEMERPIAIFARLNIKHGPNVEQLVRELPLGQDETRIEFDLAYTKLNEKRVEKLWCDLIFEGPQMNQVILRDLTFSRRPRADL
ncbi:DUF6478 family protein [Roseivivax isoporae]|uniref:Uncharacterized protein n=1 Tax=Roseivivax isoporae LMG 25204 TaxID=1449351 RepID=X7F566_9RHOB|nr:DUF6478 family protein [Roseivivax isoporae]ETX27888.1 hypothetical protein RISW2_10490 [Roseivivax isoporae LMG 25204]